MSDDTLLPFDLPSVMRKKISVAFDGGQLSSDAGVLLLRDVEKKLGLAKRLASCIREWRRPEAIVHPLEISGLGVHAVAGAGLPWPSGQ